ncbi:HAMP domain-containing methyl-accepting chemotaxis protein [Magnetococcales bacterium HHB-1]
MFNPRRVHIRLKYSFSSILLVIVILGAYSIYEMTNLSDMTDKLYKHPYAVTSAALLIDGHIAKMHRSMKDVPLSSTKEGIQKAKEKVDIEEKMALKSFGVIMERFLGDKKRVETAKQAFIDWKPIREEVIQLSLNGERDKAALITRGKGAKHVALLSNIMTEFIDFARNKAKTFHSNAEESRSRALTVATTLLLLAIFISWLFAYTNTVSLEEIINSISSSSSEMATTVNQQERVSAQQNSSINETNTTMEELGASARQSAEQAESAAGNAQNALNLAQEGLSRIEEMMISMGGTKQKVEGIAQQILRLSEQTSQIGSITNTVTDFANETKMLAMNAAVEAVRAGEHGKGFSVLSVEIRKLADESKRSAERINVLVEEIQRATNTTVMVTEEGTKTVNRGMEIAQNTSQTFAELSDSVSSASDSSQQISMNVRQQAVAVKQVVEAMQLLNTGAKENATGIGQVKNGVQMLNETIQKLKTMV